MDDLDRSDDDGPWVNGTLTIPSQAVTETGTYCESLFTRRVDPLQAPSEPRTATPPVLIVTEKQEPSGEDAPTYYVQTYNISVEITP